MVQDVNNDESVLEDHPSQNNVGAFVRLIDLVDCETDTQKSGQHTHGHEAFVVYVCCSWCSGCVFATAASSGSKGWTNLRHSRCSIVQQRAHRQRFTHPICMLQPTLSRSDIGRHRVSMLLF